jgi:hypothetical protein
MDIGIRAAFLNNVFDLNFPNHTTIKNNFDCFSLTPILQFNLLKNFNAISGIQFNFPILAEGIYNHNIRDAHQYPVSIILPRLIFGLNYNNDFLKFSYFSIIPEINIMLDVFNNVGGNFKGT